MEIGIVLPHFGPFATRETITREAHEAEQIKRRGTEENISLVADALAGQSACRG